MNQQNRIKALKSITKQADFGVVDFIVKALTPMFNSIKADPIGGIGQLLLEGAIFSSFGWTGAILTTILSEVFGINVRTLLNAIKSVIVPFMQQNQGAAIDVDAAADSLSKQVLSKVNINPAEANKTFDQIAAENPDVKTATILYNRRVGITKEAGLFGILKGLTMGGFIKSLIKALFIGAGFTGAAGAIKSTMGIGETSPNQNKDVVPSVKDKTKKIDPSKSILKYVGPAYNSYESSKIYNNDADKNEKGGEAFYIISSGDFERMMLDLVFRTYPRMPDKIAEVVEKNFYKAISPIKEAFLEWNKEDIDKQGTYIRVPTQINGVSLNSFKNIADIILSMFTIKE